LYRKFLIFLSGLLYIFYQEASFENHVLCKQQQIICPIFWAKTTIKLANQQFKKTQTVAKSNVLQESGTFKKQVTTKQIMSIYVQCSKPG